MSVNIEIKASSTNICIGCLSLDRKLAPVVDIEHKMYFLQLQNSLNSLSTSQENLLLCWECSAFIGNAIKFRNRVRSATDFLMKIKLNNPPSIQCLSQLTIKNTSEKIYEYLDNPTEPLAEIKIEQAAEDFDNEIFDHNTETFDDSTSLHYAIEKTEADQPNSNTRSPSMDSDDIPLKNISKHHKKDKKKDRSKQKEKPAGVIFNKSVRKKLKELNMNSDDIQMILLSWEEVELERQKALVSEAFTKQLFKCYDCVIGFNHKFKLENHMKKHEEFRGLACSVCGVRCASRVALGSHRRRHRVRWSCVRCDQRWSRAPVAADHVAREHAGKTPRHCCGTCGRLEPTLGKLRIHLKSHKERQKCDLCDKTFRDKTSLRTHLFIHKGEKEYSCTKCEKKFLFKKAMEIHMITHEASAELYCHECNMNFKNKMSYYQHIKYNLKHIDPAKLKYACEWCDKRFVKSVRLQEHKTAVHLKMTPIKCTFTDCTFACASRPVLRTHIRMIHRNRKADRNHVCHSCGKAYMTKKTLEGHMRTHTGERPFKCKLCPSTFGYEAALYNHNKLVHLKAKRSKVGPTQTQNSLVTTSTSNWGLNLEVTGERLT